MLWFLLLACSAGGFVLYFAIVRPLARFFLPLTQRIPTGSEYRASCTSSSARRRYV